MGHLRILGSRVTYLIAACAFQATACGGNIEHNDADNTDSGGGAAHPVDDSASVDELSDSDLEALCSEVEEFAGKLLSDDYREAACVLDEGVTTASLDACNNAVARCSASVPTTETASIKGECVADLSAPGCQATAAQVRSCIADELDLYESFARSATCQAVFIEGRHPMFPDEPASCRVFEKACPPAFEGSEVEAPPVNTPVGGPVAEGPIISGSVDGEPISVAPDGFQSTSSTSSGTEWSTNQKLGAANLWLWSHAGPPPETRGIMRMPDTGPLASRWLCLDDVGVSLGPFDTPESWSASSLSVLAECSPANAPPLELEFDLGGEARANVWGDEVLWLSRGFSCVQAQCDLSFDDHGSEVLLAVKTEGQSPGPGLDVSLVSATYIDQREAGSVACGGTGTLAWSATDHFRISLDHLSEPESCPGNPVAGELKGEF